VVEYLIQAGADPNSLSNYDNSTALHMAVLGGSKKIVEILLANGSVQRFFISIRVYIYISLLLNH
jgi:ankyrin repeat protein